MNHVESWNDSEISGHTASAYVVTKPVFMVKLNGTEGYSHHLLHPEEMKKTVQILMVLD
jgi:hypothetical protein